MAIDSTRLLIDSAGPLWRRLAAYGAIDVLPVSDGFEDWLGRSSQVRPGDCFLEQQLRRDYRRLVNLLNEIETLVRSRNVAIAMVRQRAAERVPL